MQKIPTVGWVHFCVPKSVGMHTFFYGRLQLHKLSALKFWYGIFLVLGTQKYSTLTLSTYVPTTAQTCNVTIPRGAGSIVSSGVTAASPIQHQHNSTTVSARRNPPALPQIDLLRRLRLHFPMPSPPPPPPPPPPLPSSY